MRKLTRTSPPAMYSQNVAKWNQQWIDLRQNNPAARFLWYEKDGISSRDMILNCLRDMSADHCCFCDCFPISDRCSESVEHFYPKSEPKFYHKAFDWNNLFYCCDKCQKAKGNKFDEDLLKPDSPDYFFEAYFEFDYTNGAIIAKNGNNRADITIRMYDLDTTSRRTARMLELRKWIKAPSEIDEFGYRDYLEGEAL